MICCHIDKVSIDFWLFTNYPSQNNDLQRQKRRLTERHICDTNITATMGSGWLCYCQKIYEGLVIPHVPTQKVFLFFLGKSQQLIMMDPLKKIF